MSFTAKSVVVDIATNWGYVGRLGLRSMEFMLNSILIPLSTSDFSAYSTSSLSSYYDEQYVFDTNVSKIGTTKNNQWYSNNVSSFQRLIVVLNTPIEFDEIVINNAHSYGSYTDMGAKDVVINITPDTITNTTYGAAISNSVSIFDGQFNQHVSSNVADPQTLTLSSGETEETALQDMAMDIQAFYGAVLDTKLDVEAYYQSMDSCPVDIYLSGNIIQDSFLDLVLAENAVSEMPMDIRAYFESLFESRLDLNVGAWARKDNQLDLLTALQNIENMTVSCVVAAEQAGNAFLDISLSNGIITQGMAMDISLGDGNKTQNMGMDCMAVSTLPEFKSIYAMNLNSAIKEVTS